MPSSLEAHLPHLFLKNTAKRENYINPVGGRSSWQLPYRDRSKHGQYLQSQVAAIATKAAQLIAAQKLIAEEANLLIRPGTYIEFQSEPNYNLKIESLEDSRRGIELVTVKKEIPSEGGDLITATVFVREGQ